MTARAVIEAAEALAVMYRRVVAEGVVTLGPCSRALVDACDAHKAAQLPVDGFLPGLERCVVQTDGTPCLWQWATPDTTGRVHSCSSRDGHRMEHRCVCGELYPS